MSVVPDSDRARRLLTASGAEDGLRAEIISLDDAKRLATFVPGRRVNTYTTGANFRLVLDPVKDAEFPSVAEAMRHMLTASEDSAMGYIIRKLGAERRITTKAAVGLTKAATSLRVQELELGTPQATGYMKTSAKVSRAVDILCRAQSAALDACTAEHKGAPHAEATRKCVKENVAFDKCTEEF